MVHIENHRRGDKLFDASLVLQRRVIGAASLASMLFRFPFMTAKVMLAIYYEALRIWLKKIPFVQHPKHAEAPGTVKDS